MEPLRAGSRNLKRIDSGTMGGATKVSETGKRLIQFYGRPIIQAREIKGIWEIGWGMRYYPDGKRVKLGHRLSREDADKLFYYSIERYEQAVLKAVRRPLQQHEFDALVSLVRLKGSFFYTDRNTLSKRSPALIRRINASKYIRENIKSTRNLWEELWIPSYSSLFSNENSIHRVQQQRCSEAHLFLTGELKLLKPISRK